MKWEYMVVPFQLAPDPNELSRFGAIGWELVAVTFTEREGYVLFFKRQKDGN